MVALSLEIIADYGDTNFIFINTEWMLIHAALVQRDCYNEKKFKSSSLIIFNNNLLQTKILQLPIGWCIGL